MASGLACVSGLCIKDDFAIAPAANQCVRVECDTTEDCCGGKPKEFPSKCAARATTCASTLPGCALVACTDSDQCNGGTCGGYCSNTAAACTGDDDCAVDNGPCDLDLGQCTVNGLLCEADADCIVAAACLSMACDCTNPDYDPLDPICSDSDCEDLCTKVCQNELCVEDTSCEEDIECVVFPYTTCHEGACVQCVSDDDCDEDEGEACRAGSCQKPCEANEGCPLFHSCQDGECVETGCTSDRECVLAAGSMNYGEDARLAVCVSSDANPDIKQCRIPCESDTTCGQFSVCDDGYCKFVGCESDEECRGYLGLANQQLSDAQPYYTRAECRPPERP